jgi:hypothetical protein
MPLLLSGSQKNTSSPGGYANITNVQYQLGPTPKNDTGYTLITNNASQATYVSSLGNLEFNFGSVVSNLPNQNITFIGTGTGNVIITGLQANVSTNTGVLVVQGGVGISKSLYTGQDINVNGLTIGRGYSGANNIVITGAASSITNSVDFDGENSISIGWSALGGLTSSQNSIAIGRYALSSGTNLTNTIAIGDSSLQKAGTISSVFVGNISAISTGTSTVITIVNHGLTTGSSITIRGVGGLLGTNLNGNTYLTNVINVNSVSLYDFIYPDDLYYFAKNSVYSLVFTRNSAINSTNFGTGTVTSAVAYKNIVTYANIAIGTSAGQSFYNGQHNFFLGDGAAPNFTSGNFNFFIGYNVGENMITGDNNISFSSKLMRSGYSNQIGFGNVFYYDGIGKTSISSTVFMGDTSAYSDATGSFNGTGALQVYGGAGIRSSLFVGANLNATGTGVITLSPAGTGTVAIYPSTTGLIDNMIIGANNAQTATFFAATISSAIDTTGVTSGALNVVGGVGIAKSAYMGLNTDTNTLNVRSTAAANSTTNGAVTISGGVGVQGSIYSQDGNPNENNLLYSPKVTVSNTVPLNPNIADFWINTTNLVEYQYIIDGTSTFWIQIAQL